MVNQLLNHIFESSTSVNILFLKQALAS